MDSQTIIFLLVVGLGLLLRLLSNRTQQPTKTPAAPAPRAAETDEERVRRFLEALGQPPSAEPPPKVQPRPAKRRRAVIPKVPTITPRMSPLPPLTTTPEFEVTEAPPLPPVVETFIPPPLAALPYEAPAVGAPQPETVPQRAGQNRWTAMLLNKNALRDAIVLREIFGPPRALQNIGEQPVPF